MSIDVACPLCGTRTKVSDRASGKRIKCPECSELLVVPAAAVQPELLEEVHPVSSPPPRREGSSTLRPRQPAEVLPTDEPPRRCKTGSRGIPGIVWALGIPVVMVTVCCGGCTAIGMWGVWQESRELAQADKLHAEGKQEEAVSIYKKYPSHLLDLDGKGLDALRRVAEYEVSKGHTAEARNWMERALDKQLQVTYDSPPARKLLEAIKQERADKVARLEQEARRQQEEREKAMTQAQAEAARQAEVERHRKAQEEAEESRKAEVEYDADGLVLLRKTVDAKRGEFSIEITGTVVNRRSRKLTYAQISFNLYDDSGAQVGTALANINGLEPGGRWNFKAVGLVNNARRYKFSELSGF